MAKKAKAGKRYTAADKASYVKAVEEIRSANGSWKDAHNAVASAGYKGGLDSLKQLIRAAGGKKTKGKKATRSHRVGNAKTFGGSFLGNGKKAFGGSILGNGRKAFFSAIGKLIDQQVAAEIKAFKAQFAKILK